MVEHVGFFSKERIAEVAKEVERRRNARRDFVADRSKIKVIHADKALNVHIDGQDVMATFRRASLSQLATSLDVPLTYIDRLEGQHGDLIATNLNTLLARETHTPKGKPKRHLLRLLDGELDAFLSDSYRALGNHDLLALCLDVAKKAGAQVWDLRLTRDSFRFLAVAPHIAGKVQTDRTFTGADGFRSRWEGDAGDTLNAGAVVENSETGRGGLTARPAIFRRVCENFCVWADGIVTVHLGGKIKEEGEV